MSPSQERLRTYKLFVILKFYAKIFKRRGSVIWSYLILGEWVKHSRESVRLGQGIFYVGSVPGHRQLLRELCPYYRILHTRLLHYEYARQRESQAHTCIRVRTAERDTADCDKVICRLINRNTVITNTQELRRDII